MKIFNINLEYKSGTDPREDIFNHAVSQSWVITEMRVSEKNLEDIFRNLTNTSDEGAPMNNINSIFKKNFIPSLQSDGLHISCGFRTY